MFRRVFLVFITCTFTALSLMQCTTPSSSEDVTRVTVRNIWFSDAIDTDQDGYVSNVYLNFDLDTNKDMIDVAVRLWVRYTDPADTAAYDEYFTSASFTIEGNNNTADARYIVIGEPNVELPEGVFDFLLEVFPGNDPDGNPVAEASWHDFGLMAGLAFEPFNADQIPELYLSEDFLNFGSTDDVHTFDIQNYGGSILEWDIYSDQNWLTVSDYVGDTETETDIVSVYVDRAGLNSGIYNGTLTITPNYGSAQTIGVQMEVSADPFELTITNEVFTDISIDVDGQDFRVIPPGEQTTYYYASNPGTVSFYGETSGKTAEETQIGLNIFWDKEYNVSGLETMERNLIITSDFFFIYVQNNGVHDLHNFYVNYGKTEETFDNIYLPADGVTYRIGYYRAFNDTQVRAWWYQENTYVYWNQGEHYTLPFDDNQYVILTNNTKMIPESVQSAPMAKQFKVDLIPVKSGIPNSNRVILPENRVAAGIKTKSDILIIDDNQAQTQENIDLKIPGYSREAGPPVELQRVDEVRFQKRPDLSRILKKK